MANNKFGSATSGGAGRRKPVGVRVALAVMDRIGGPGVSQATGRLAVSTLGRVVGATVAVGIGVIGWFAMIIMATSGAMTVVSIVAVPAAIGALAASIGRNPKLRWPLLGFVLLPIVALLSTPRTPPNGEGSGFLAGALDVSLLGLPVLCLGFYGWLRIRRSWAHRSTGQRVTFPHAD